MMFDYLFTVRNGSFSEFGYIVATEQLYVVFPNSVYVYNKVPRATFEEMATAPHVNEFFNNRIKGTDSNNPPFEYRRVGENEIVRVFGRNPIRKLHS